MNYNPLYVHQAEDDCIIYCVLLPNAVWLLVSSSVWKPCNVVHGPLHVTFSHMHVCSMATFEQRDLHVFASIDKPPWSIMVKACYHIAIKVAMQVIIVTWYIRPKARYCCRISWNYGGTLAFDNTSSLYSDPSDSLKPGPTLQSLTEDWACMQIQNHWQEHFCQTQHRCIIVRLLS